MNLREEVKQLLRMCGHALVSTVHDRLNGIEGTLQQILEQNTHLASTQTALLHSGVHLVESLARVRAELAETESRISSFVQERTASKEDLEEVRATLAELRDQSLGNKDVLELVRAATTEDLQVAAAEVSGHAASKEALQSLFDRIVELSSSIQRVRDSGAVLEPVVRATGEFLENQSVRQVCVETSDYFFTNPELGLLAFLYSYLPSRTVLDVGAHIGDVSEHLLDTGYQVYAFEPFPQSYSRLVRRLGERPDFHAFNLALGNVTGELPMYTVRDHSSGKIYEDTTVFNSLSTHGMPPNLTFESTVPVKIRRLAELQRDGLVPANVGFVKIDTEGYDLEVVRGMEDQGYPAVMVEFWDAAIPFASQGLRYTVESMVREMRQRGYPWYIVIYRVWGHNETAYYSNHDRPVPGSWGNLIFFQNREIFDQAQLWCAAVLPRTYFKHVAAPESTQ